MGKPEPGDGTFNFYSGENMVLRPEPAHVKLALRKIGIHLNNFDITITGVYARPRPIGFDFYCGLSSALMAQAKKNAKLRQDDRSKAAGQFVALMAKGESFRQIGEGASLHMVIAPNGKCNVHIDTTGFVGKCGYNFVNMLGHGYFDLATDLLPGAFVAFGDKGIAGLVAAPMKGVDGKTRMIYGIKGRW